MRAKESASAARSWASVAAAFLALATLVFLARPAYALDLSTYQGKLHFARAAETYAGDGDNKITYIWWVLEDEEGNWVESIELPGDDPGMAAGSTKRPDGKSNGLWVCTEAAPYTQDDSIPKPGEGHVSSWPSEVRSRIDWSATDDNGQQAGDFDSAGSENGRLPSAETDWSGKVIRGYVEGDVTDPGGEFHDVEVPPLGIDSIGNIWLLIERALVCDFLAPATMLLSAAASWAINLIDPSLVFTGSWEGGTYSALYDAALAVSSVIAPLAKTFMGVMFAIALLDPARPRLMRGDSAWLDHWIRACGLFLMGWALIDYAVPAVGWVFRFGSGLASGISSAAPTQAMGADILTRASLGLQTLTYGTFAMVFAYVAVAVVVLKQVVGYVLKVLTVLLTRIGELYLRASLAAIPFSHLAAGRDARTAGSFMKRLMACACEVAAVTACVAITGALYPTLTGVVGDLVARAGALPWDWLTPIAQAVAAAASPLFALAACTSAVEKASAVAGSMFGTR